LASQQEALVNSIKVPILEAMQFDEQFNITAFFWFFQISDTFFLPAQHAASKPLADAKGDCPGVKSIMARIVKDGREDVPMVPQFNFVLQAHTQEEKMLGALQLHARAELQHQAAPRLEQGVQSQDQRVFPLQRFFMPWPVHDKGLQLDIVVQANPPFGSGPVFHIHPPGRDDGILRPDDWHKSVAQQQRRPPVRHMRYRVLDIMMGLPVGNNGDEKENEKRKDGTLHDG
jgi:hypothetical protein